MILSEEKFLNEYLEDQEELQATRKTPEVCELYCPNAPIYPDCDPDGTCGRFYYLRKEHEEKKEEVKSLFGNLDFLRELIKLHSADIEPFVAFTKEPKSSERMWLELVYCILAGTQIKSSLVQDIFKKLVEEHLDFIRIESFRKDDEGKLADVLREYGYRFYKSKAQTIRNAARYFIKYFCADVNRFLNRLSVYQFRGMLSSAVRGIGYKIASHWLRNIGYDMPVVDIHVKRLLYNFRLVLGSEKLSYRVYEKALLQIATQLKESCTVIDMALWLHGIKFCSQRKCQVCPVYKKCHFELKRGRFTK